MSTDMERAAAPRGKRIPTERQRFLAATIRVDADKKLKRETPDWIVKIATDGKDTFAH